MNNSTAFWLLVISAIMAIVKTGGVNLSTLFVFTFIATLIGIVWFFSARRSKPVTTFEKVAATTWLFIRRLVGIIGALFFLMLALAIAFNLIEGTASIGILKRLGYALFVLWVSIFCLWVVIYGQGWNRFALKDDVELHRENKKRYGWRW